MNKIYLSLAVVIIILILIAIPVFIISQPAKNGSENQSSSTPATVSLMSVEKTANTAGAANSGERVIRWQTSNYPTNLGVNINLLRKTSDSPKTYELVRQIAKNTPNDGEEAWTPAQGETGDNLYIEVTCASDASLTQPCSLNTNPIKI